MVISTRKKIPNSRPLVPSLLWWIVIGIILILIIWLITRNLEKFTDMTGLNTLGGIVYINLDKDTK